MAPDGPHRFPACGNGGESIGGVAGPCRAGVVRIPGERFGFDGCGGIAGDGGLVLDIAVGIELLAGNRCLSHHALPKPPRPQFWPRIRARMVTLSGGDGLEKALQELAKNVKRGGSVRVGFLEGSTYPNGTSVALVAAVNEFGQTRIHPHQPPRPFFRTAIRQNSPQWPQILAHLLEQNNCDTGRTLSQIGAVIVGQIQQSIVDFTDPGLAPSTIAAKGSDKPLIRDGVMLKSVAFEVSDSQ